MKHWKVSIIDVVQIKGAITERVTRIGVGGKYSPFYQCECGFVVSNFPHSKTKEILCPLHGWVEGIIIDPDIMRAYL